MTTETAALGTWDDERRVWTVKRTEHWLVEVCPMVFNFRVVLTPVTCLEVWDHGWCFFGTDAATLTKAMLAATAFDPETQAAPVGYDKALTSRR